MSYFDPGKAASILIFMPDKHMGNVIVSLPAILSVVNYFKDKVKGIIVEERYKEILYAFFEEEIVIPYNLRNIKSKISLMINFLNFIRKIRGFNPSVSIDFENRTTGAILSYFSGAKHRIGFESGDKSYYYNLKIPVKEHDHITEFYSFIPSELNISVNNNITPKIKDGWKNSLLFKFKNEFHSDKIEKLVCIHPGAGKIYKKWTPENFASVADYLIDKGFSVILIGSVRDKVDILNVKSHMKYKAWDLCGKISLGELMALFTMTKLYIGNDSGPMHLASLFNIPIIGLFGPSDEKRWKPRGENVIVLRGTERCIKCKGKHCEQGFRCISSIKIDNVMDSISKIKTLNCSI